jgi:DNA-directed RNA polymerase subunit RPC12/RpoP
MEILDDHCTWVCKRPSRALIFLCEYVDKDGLMTTQHVFPCERCGQKLRVPLIAGKSLRVDCPSCGHEGVVSFKAPGAKFLSRLLRRPKLFTLAIVLALVGIVFLIGHRQQSALHHKLQERGSETVRIL